jgi:carbon-monoxide dehydrogenase medium subunit
MKPAPFEFVRAFDLKQAFAALMGCAGQARVLAGGQTLGPMLNMRLTTPSLLVDIGAIEPLRNIERRSTGFFIGASVTHSSLEDLDDSSPLGKLLSYVASTIAYRAIRNRGTIGGSLSHADPAADWATLMMALDAELTLAATSGTRKVKMSDFMIGALTTVIQPAEILVGIEVPNLSGQARWGYYKICRKAGEFPDAIGAIILDAERKVSRIAVGAIDRTPVLLNELAFRVAAHGVSAATPESVTAAVAEAAPHLDSVDLQLHTVAVRRAVLCAIGHD